VSGRLVILCGLPGSGKTTVAKALEQRLEAVRMSADDWMVALDADLFDGGRRSRIEAIQWDLTQRLLALGQVVLIEWGTWARSERDALRTRARELGAAVELHYLTAGLDVLFERVQARGMELACGSRAVTLEDMRAYASVLEPPGDDELALYDPALDVDQLLLDNTSNPPHINRFR